MGWGQGVSLQGKDGATILFGNGAPTAAQGNLNDVYFDQDASYIYQKGANGWPSQGVLLQGKMGFGGADGFSFDVGASNPASTDGKPGDFFVNYATGEVFGPKGSDNSWPDTGFSLKGIPGEAGKDGLRGTQTFYGVGAPTAQTITDNNAMAGDNYYDLTPGAVKFFVLKADNS